MTQQTNIHLVRHAHVHNPDQIFYGRLPRFRLSMPGRQQAKSGAQFFINKKVKAIFSSPLLRSRQTASVLSESFGLTQIRISSLITEIKSPFEGQPSEVVDARHGDIYSEAGPKYEQPQDIVNRIQRFFCRTTRAYAGEHTVAVTHGDVIVFAILWAMDKRLDPRYKGQMDSLGFQCGYPAHASVTTFIFQDDDYRTRPKIKYWDSY
jgi:broad specificity phosphatase PhoE